MALVEIIAVPVTDETVTAAAAFVTVPQSIPMSLVAVNDAAPPVPNVC